MPQNLRIVGFFLGVSLVLSGCGNGSVPTDPAPPTEPVPACDYGAETLDSLEVAAGETCFLTTTTVRGDLTLASGSSLEAIAGVKVGGNVQGDGAANVSLDEAVVVGDVQLAGGGTVNVTGATIDGNLQLINNSGAIGISDNVVEGDVQVSQNTGGVFIDFNFISGNLQCEQNSPAPTGSDNEVSDSKEGQCSGF